MANAEMLINVFMTWRLDCNALLAGCYVHLINKLQLVQNETSFLEPGSMNTLVRFCQYWTASLLNIVNILKSC